MSFERDGADERSRGDATLDLVNELLATSERDRPHRLAKLAKPILVQLAAAALARLQRERARVTTTRVEPPTPADHEVPR